MPDDTTHEQFTPVDIESEMRDSFLEYAMSVIVSRALPDVRDGLKPVHRRILYSMWDGGIRPGTPYRKASRVVGDVVGWFHPHSNEAVYDSMVRLAQDFAMRAPLIDPQGNFGTVDDPPAAMRYVEARLAKLAAHMLDGIDEDTVDFTDNYSGERQEPVVLPARFPNLLVNGSTGIAVGMATNMAPHNLGEVCDAVLHALDHTDATPEDLMQFVKGPDFPTGGYIVGNKGINDALLTGRGSIKMRAVTDIVEIRKGRLAIVVTEIPYQVSRDRIMEKLADAVRNKSITGIADLRDESDRLGTRLVIELKKDANAQVVLNQVFKHSQLEDTFSVNNVALVDGVPRTLNLAQLVHHYVDHQLVVIERRSRFRLEKAEARAHIVRGLLIALDNIDEVVRIIRSSENVDVARTGLMEGFELSEIQANHILDMQLRRLTALEKLKLEEEVAALRDQIAEYEKILASEQRQRTIVLKELEEMVERYGAPRRSRIIRPDQIDDVSIESMIEAPEGLVDEPCRITLSASGIVGREPAGGPKQSTFGRHDVLRTRVETRTTGKVIGITNTGRVLVSPAAAIPEITGRSRGVTQSEAFTTQKGESIVGLVAGPAPSAATATGADLAGNDEPTPSSDPWMIVTANGVVKRIAAKEITSTASTRTIVNLKSGDTVVAMFPAPDDAEVVLVSSNAQALRISASTVTVQGRGAGGVAGMKLSEGAAVIAAAVVGSDAIVLTHTDAMTAKVTDAAEVPLKGRGTAGVRLTKFRDERRVDFAYVGPDAAGLSVIVGTEDNPSKPDPNPESLTIAPSARDLISRPVSRRILDVGFGRW
ncbi:MAG: DNA topoisomerase 4 subunit A [Acidimicrobiia bacterium]|nr:DNA topoisomerase 4 subunit A [Acidimicrobiia bacterium]